MILRLNKQTVPIVSSLSGRYRGQQIVIAIDASKTNTGIAVCSRTYALLDLIEMDGSEDRDIFALTKLERDACRTIFEGAHIVDGGIEDIITKKDETAGGKFSQGLQHHHSRQVITAVYCSYIMCFQDYFNFMLELVPNQTWKNVVLPKELNKRGVYKGSVEYIRGKYPKYVTADGKNDDGTDAICISEYLKLRKGYDKSEVIEDIPDTEELGVNPCRYRLYPDTQEVPSGKSVQFKYNSNLPLDMNARMIANRIQLGKYGWAVLETTDINIEDIYARCRNGPYPEHADKLKLIVRRVESCP